MKVGFPIAALSAALVAFEAQAAVIAVAPAEVAVTANGQCSLIEAIQNAESGSDLSGGDCTSGTNGADTIELAEGSTYVLTSLQDDSTGLPRIRSTLTIRGQGATIERDASLFNSGETACSGSGQKFRLLFVAGDGNLTVDDLTLRNGCAQAGGGAIMNHGVLQLDRVVIEDSESILSGGGIHNDGTLTMRESTIRNTRSRAAGGGLVNRGSLTLERSLIEGSYSVGAGGGLDAGRQSATLNNVTVSGNQSKGLGGGAVVTGGSFTSTNVTVAYNASNAEQPDAQAGDGGGFQRMGGTLTLNNTLLAMQANGTNNCSGSITHNSTISDDSTCSGTPLTPLISPLANNGGPTRTHALISGSAAIDAGDDALATALTTDQRGSGFPRIIGAHVDIGAYEFGDNDGLDASEEDNVPNPDGGGNGDGNGDGIPDSQQGHVASFDTSTGSAMATLATSSESKPLVNVSPEPAPIDAPPGVQFPYGLFSFTITNVEPGSTEEIELFVPFNAAITGYWKKDTSGEWANIATSITQVGNKTRIVFPLTEGGPYDFDADNTTITDPGGPGIQSLHAQSIPSLSQWMTLLLSVLLATAAYASLRRRS